MTKNEAYAAYLAKLNEPVSQNCYLNCAHDEERGLYWIEYESGERFEFDYKQRIRICKTCGAEIESVYVRCTSCHLTINEKCGL